MTARLTSIFALLLSVAFLLMGNGLQVTLLPVRANLELFGTFDIGILGSAYYCGFAIGCLYAPLIIRRAGHIRTFTAMVAIASSVVLGHSLLAEPVLWWLLRMITGFCFATLFMVIESWLNESSTNETRGTIFAIYTTINLTVVALGQLMLALGEPTDFPLFALASILVSLAAVPVALSKSEAPIPPATIDISIMRLYRLSPVGAVGCLTFGLTSGAFWALGAVFAQATYGSTLGVAAFVSAVVIAGALGQWPLGRLSDIIDRRWILVLSTVGAGLSGLALILAANMWNALLFVPALFFGFFAFPVYALSVAHMNDSVDAAAYVETAGGLLLVFALGAIVGPILASAVIASFGLSGLFAFTALVHAAAAAFCIYRIRSKARPPEEERTQFIEALQMAQTVANIDPTSPSDTPSGPGSK
jgi:MFS family permease